MTDAVSVLCSESYRAEQVQWMIEQVVHGRYDPLTEVGRYFVLCVEMESGEGKGGVEGGEKGSEGEEAEKGDLERESERGQGPVVHSVDRRKGRGPTDVRGVIVGAGGWSTDVPSYDVHREEGAESVNGETNLSESVESATASDAGQAGAEKRSAWIRGIYVHPRYARRGLGKMIVIHCEQEAGRAGFERFELASTVNAVPVYERCGYKPWETRTIEMENASGIEMDIVMMRKGWDG